MKITDRIHYEEYVELVFDSSQRFALFFPILDTRYIPSVGQDWLEIDNSVWAVIIKCPHCGTEIERHVYALVNQLTGEVKEIV